MKEPSQMTILGILMQQDAERSQPDDSRRAASWQVISQAISQPAPVAGRQSGTEAMQPKTIWNPRSVFNPQSASRSSWHYPSRRLVYQAFALVLVVAIFLAAGLFFGRGGFVPIIQPTVTIPDDTIPLVEPSAGLPSATDLQVYLPIADSIALAGLPALSAERQRTELEALCNRAGLLLTQVPAAGEQVSTYWTARRDMAGQSRSLLILAREIPGQAGWTAVYQLVPSSLALPVGANLDKYFAALLASSLAG